MEGEMQRTLAWMAAVMIVTGVLSGCRAETTKDGAGERVKVATPFGGLEVKVRTDEDAAGAGTGLPIYQGATLVTKGDGKGKDSGTADINLSLGSMRLRIEVLSYRTADTPEQVRSFYAKEMGRFGTVIACSGDRPIGSPTRTAEGLTCDKDGHDTPSGGSGSVDADGVELKAGSQQHQHAVSIEKDGGGTKFALIRIDLPKRFAIGDDRPGEQGTQ